MVGLPGVPVDVVVGAAAARPRPVGAEVTTGVDLRTCPVCGNHSARLTRNKRGVPTGWRCEGRSCRAAGPTLDQGQYLAVNTRPARPEPA